MIRYLLILFVLVLARPLVSEAQQLGCGTLPPTPAQVKYLLETQIPFEKNTRARTNGTIKYFPVKPFIIRKTDGTGNGTELEIMQGLVKTNKKFIYSGIQFYIANGFGYINNDTFYNFDASKETQLGTHDISNVINIYFANKVFSQGQEIGGYAYLPGGQLRILMNINFAADGNTLPHELGHFFNLHHTFNNNNAANTSDRELVKRTNCTTTGDYICDTPADPFDLPNATVTDCVYAGAARDAGGDLFTPALDNVMSYYFCGDNFTPNQYTRIGSAAQLSRANLAFTATDPTAPANLTAIANPEGVQLTWQDRATNEVGYFVERSTSPTADFVSMGAVSANQVSFTDKDAASRTTYYYRVKAANAKDTYSNMATATTGVTYCEPTYKQPNCSPDDGTFLDEFVLKESVTEVFANRQSGCASYSNFTQKSVSVTVGKTYTFTIKLNILPGNSYYPQKIGIWADLNQDGDFEDTGEVLYRSSTTPHIHTGSFAIPATAKPGNTRLRIRSVADQNVTLVDKPCGAYSYGETEDYTLQIAPTCATYLPTVTADQSTICAGQSVALTASPGGTSYTWSPTTGLNNAAIANPVAAPTQTTTYTVTATLNGCQKTASITVNVNPLTVTLTPFNPVCSTTTAFILTGAQPAGGIYSGPGVTNGIFNAVTAGLGTHSISYSYTANNCTTTATQALTVSTCNGIKESALAAALVVYPNPSNGLVQIKLPVTGQQDLSIRVVNSQGQTIAGATHKKVTGELNTHFDLRDQAKGIYLVQVLTPNEVATRKIILQ